MATRGRVCSAVAFWLATWLGFLASAAAQQAPVLVKEITVEGNRRVQEAVILGRVKTTLGGPFNTSQLSEDVRSVFSLGFFDDVQLRVDDFEGGVKVTFVVTERPFIRDVEFIGNKKASASELQEKIDIKLGSVYNPVDVQRARERMKDFYEDEGYFEVQITPDIEKFADGDVKLLFTINEGRQMKIDKIVIRGNSGLTDKQIKEVMATQERQYYILRGTVQRQRLEDDVERILQIYNDHGYIHARVESHDVTVDREKARVTINIVVVEGAQHRVSTINATGVTLLPESEVRRQFKMKDGDVFSRSKLRDSVKAIEELYSNIGRASAEINPKVEPQVADNKIAVTFEINEGPTVYVERINIAGNVRSQDKILRRELQLSEGDIFTLRKLQRSRQRLVNLTYFEKVEVTTAPGADKTKIIVNVDVTERPTGMFSIGGGFSSQDSFLGTIDLSQNNFLGRGWQASIKLRAGAKTQQGIISFTEPWLFDRPLAAGFDLFNTRRQFIEYNYDTLGGGVRLSHPFEEYWRWNAGYRLTRDEISNIQNELSVLESEKGVKVTSLVQGGVSRDSRDSIQAPSRGGTVNLFADVAGLGGDSHYLKTVASTTYFQPIWFDHILSGRAEIGYGFGFGHEDLPLFERFYLGGSNSIRSFKSRQISPVDDQGTRIGGTTEVLGNVEYIVPLPFNVRAAVFFDVGNVYGFGTKFDLTDLRTAVGGGLRWLSPFGPIRVDYGFNLDQRAGEKPGAFNFSVGSPF